MKNLPNDFRALGKGSMPATAQVSGNKLQENFEYLDGKWPYAFKGSMLYYDGEDWVVLASPSGSGMFVLSHDGTEPSWIETEGCEETPP